MAKKLILIILITFISLQHINAQPTKFDYILGYTGLGLSLSLEFLFKDNFAPEEPHYTGSNSFDTFFRNSLKWKNDKLKTADGYSDIFLYLIVVPSIFWTPLLTDYNYNSFLLTNVEVLAVNGIITNIIKFSVGRQRPSSYYGTQEGIGSDNNLSFISGHTSNSFAIATSTAYLLSKNHPRYKRLIWTTAMSTAAITGYLRIAADVHYMSDVLMGAVVGSFVGYWIPRLQFERFFSVTMSGRKEVTLSFQKDW